MAYDYLTELLCAAEHCPVIIGLVDRCVIIP